MPDIRLLGSATALAEPPETDGFFDDEYTLDVRVVVAAHPNGKLQCNTDDNCGSTCQNSSACNSYTEDPA
ncbi:FxLD family lanthipeptide [Streptomyces litchfieldiae]|uniref:FxLD family lanthipeptide n=1 Tax=Streptomyces litchfieldiae TaxID=3075543 RepID=A0ABU2MNM0_9ACTN|nr:FxLD family lanthipeptide [Streptomyces sp. DSM 44938]MDT0343051.1 FxLD family lanthipeptide [Streptomyces sp. DSM 44938]